MKKKLIIGAIITVAVIAVAFFGIKNQMSKQSDENVIKIGVLGFSTGMSAQMSVELLNGIQLACDDIQANPTFKDINIKLIIEDGQAQAKASIAAFNKLIFDNIDAAIIGGGIQVPPVAPLAVKEEIPTIATIIPFSDFLDCNKNEVWVFKNFASSGLIAKNIADYAINELHIQRVALLSLNASIGEEAANSFKSEFTKRGGIIVREESYGIEEVNLRPQVLKILETKPDAIQVIGYGLGYCSAINQIRELGFTGKILTNDVILDPFNENAIKSFEDIIYGAPCPPITSQYLDVKERYESKFNMPLTLYSISGYDSLMILAKAIKLANENNCNLQESLKNLKQVDALIGCIIFEENGDCIIPIKISEIASSEN